MNKASWLTKTIGVGIFIVFSQTGCGGLGKVIPHPEIEDQMIPAEVEKDFEPPAPAPTLTLPNPKDLGPSPTELTNPRHWDRILQEANSDLHNPTDIDYFGNAHRRNGDGVERNQSADILIQAEPFPARGLEAFETFISSQREAREQVEREAREEAAAAAERRAREQAELARQEAECREIPDTSWDPAARRCSCNAAEGFYNFGHAPNLQCKQSLGSLLIHLEVAPDRNPGGTDADLAIEVCSKASQCIVKTVSTDGDVFERDTINEIRITFGNDFIIPHDEFDFVAIKNTGELRERPNWLLKEAAIYSSIYQGNADRRILSTLIEAPSLIASLLRPRSPEWREELFNSCILREIDEGNFFILGEVRRTSCDD